MRPLFPLKPHTHLQFRNNLLPPHRQRPRLARPPTQRHRRRSPSILTAARSQRGVQQAIASELVGIGA